ELGEQVVDTALPSASRIWPLLAPILRCSNVASILVAISDMRWFTAACTPLSILSEPKARTFFTSSTEDGVFERDVGHHGRAGLPLVGGVLDRRRAAGGGFD